VLIVFLFSSLPHNIQLSIAAAELIRCKVFSPDPLGNMVSHCSQWNLSKYGKHLDLSVQLAISYYVKDRNIFLPGKRSVNKSCCLR